MSKQFFSDPLLQAQFDEKGYVVVDFWSASETQAMYNFWANNTPEADKENGIFVSAHRWEAPLSLSFSNEVMALAQPRAKEILPNWRVEGACFIVKAPLGGEQTEFTLHQDYNMVDENAVPSLGLWIALVDTNTANGGLFALPGSHSKFAGTLRGANMPSFSQPLDYQIAPLVEHIEVKAGQACIFAHSLFHGSPSNTTPYPRPIIHAGLFAPDSKPYHYLRRTGIEDTDIIDIMEIDRTYYYQQVVDFIANPLACPHKIVGQVKSYRPKPTRDELLLAYGIEPAPLPSIDTNEPIINTAPKKVGILPPKLKALKRRIFAKIKQLLPL